MDRKKKFKSRNNKPLSFNFDSIVKTQSPIVFRNGNFLVKFSMNKCVSSCFIDCACGICGKKFLGKAPRLSHIHFNHYEAIRKSNVSKLLKEEKGLILIHGEVLDDLTNPKQPTDESNIDLENMDMNELRRLYLK